VRDMKTAKIISNYRILQAQAKQACFIRRLIRCDQPGRCADLAWVSGAPAAETPAGLRDSRSKILPRRLRSLRPRRDHDAGERGRYCEPRFRRRRSMRGA